VKNSTVGDTMMENRRKNEEDFRRFIRESLVARAMNFLLQSWMNWFLRTFVDWYMGEASLAFAGQCLVVQLQPRLYYTAFVISERQLRFPQRIVAT